MYLRTFGGLAIETGAGGETPQLGPRRLALLAILAATGARGITREKLLGILWPEKDEEQARHTLSQTLYLLKREAGAACVSGSAQLRLDASVASDVARFNEALAAGQLARAAELQAGPFLDGFYIAGAPEFEAWVEETRARLQAALRKSLETLARTATESNSSGEAAGWWQRLLELDPFNATYAAGQIRALRESGDSARALGVARAYEARVRQELDAEPDPVIAALIAQLRAAPESPVRSTAATPAAETTTPPGRAVAHIQPAALPDESPATVAYRPRRFWVPAAAVLVLTAAAIAWGSGGRFMSRDNAASRLAVGAIESPDSASLGAVLRDMLATNLGRLNGIRVVSNTRLQGLLPPGDSLTPAAATDAARRAGANELIEGELRASAGGLTLTMRRVAIRTGEILQGYTVRAADVFALTDSAMITISSDFGVDPPPGTPTSVRTRSSVAYALYEQGLRAFYAGDYHAAVPLMYAALGRDSSFAMAAVYAWRTQVNLSRFDQASRDLPIVKRLAARAPDRERLVIDALIARFGGAPLAEFLASAQRLTERYPDEAEGHLLLGRALYNAGEWQRSIDAYNRAVAIDSAASVGDSPYCRMCEAIAGVRDSYMWFDSAATAERTSRRLISMRPNDPLGWSLLVEPLLRQGRRADAEAANATASRMSGATALDDHAMHRDLIRSGRLEELETRLVAELRTSPPELFGERPWLLAIALRNQGRLRETRDLATNGTIPGTTRRVPDYYEPIMLATAALEGGQPDEAARLFLGLVKADRARNEGAGFVARNLSWHMTLAATAFAAAGDTATVRVIADSIKVIGQQSSFVRDYRIHHFVEGLLLQSRNRHADAVESFRRSIVSLTDGYTRINLELARSLIAIQQYRDAIAVLQPALRGGVDGANTYVTHTELHEMLAHAFHGAGQRDSAAAHYAAVEKAWHKADPIFRSRYELARQRSTAAR